VIVYQLPTELRNLGPPFNIIPFLLYRSMDPPRACSPVGSDDEVSVIPQDSTTAANQIVVEYWREEPVLPAKTLSTYLNLDIERTDATGPASTSRETISRYERNLEEYGVELREVKKRLYDMAHEMAEERKARIHEREEERKARSKIEREGVGLDMKNQYLNEQVETIRKREIFATALLFNEGENKEAIEVVIAEGNNDVHKPAPELDCRLCGELDESDNRAQSAAAKVHILRAYGVPYDTLRLMFVNDHNWVIPCKYNSPSPSDRCADGFKIVRSRFIRLLEVHYWFKQISWGRVGVKGKLKDAYKQHKVSSDLRSGKRDDRDRCFQTRLNLLRTTSRTTAPTVATLDEDLVICMAVLEHVILESEKNSRSNSSDLDDFVLVGEERVLRREAAPTKWPTNNDRNLITRLIGEQQRIQQAFLRTRQSILLPFTAKESDYWEDE
jgi:hypothetical protein